MKTSENKTIRNEIKIIKARIKDKRRTCEKLNRICDGFYSDLDALETIEARLERSLKWEDGQ